MLIVTKIPVCSFYSSAFPLFSFVTGLLSALVRTCRADVTTVSRVRQSTFECAALAAGSALELTDRILDGRLQNGFALVR